MILIPYQAIFYLTCRPSSARWDRRGCPPLPRPTKNRGKVPGEPLAPACSTCPSTPPTRRTFPELSSSVPETYMYLQFVYHREFCFDRDFYLGWFGVLIFGWLGLWFLIGMVILLDRNFDMYDLDFDLVGIFTWSGLWFDCYSYFILPDFRFDREWFDRTIFFRT